MHLKLPFPGDFTKNVSLYLIMKQVKIIVWLSAIAVILSAGQMPGNKLIEAATKKDSVLFQTSFTESEINLTHIWYLEGQGKAEIDNGRLALQDTGEGLVLWLRKDFPSEMTLQFDLSFNNNRGIGVFFIAAKGINGEDILEGLQKRNGSYGQYTQGSINCYGFSLHRFFPDGRHNAGSNIRKNRGFHLINHVEPDPVINDNQTYHVKIEKIGGRLRLWVDGDLIHDWKDDDKHGAILNEGKIGFRLRGDPTCIMYLDNIATNSH